MKRIATVNKDQIKPALAGLVIGAVAMLLLGAAQSEEPAKRYELHTSQGVIFVLDSYTGEVKLVSGSAAFASFLGFPFKDVPGSPVSKNP